MPFRLGTVDGRAVLCVDDHVYDVASASGGEIGHDPLDAVAAHRRLGDLAADPPADARIGSVDEVAFGPPVPVPPSCFAIGLNYQTHVEETGLDTPAAPVVFTKFPSCITGPDAEVELGTDFADYEVELVAVVGTGGSNIAAHQAWDHIAGLTVGNDVSDRALQFAAKPPHFALGKSRDGYGPIGPTIVSVDSFDDPDDIELWCEVNGEERQRDRTSSLIVNVPDLVAYLSAIVTLRPGDLIFTGTPAGVGGPTGQFLRPGDRVTCTVDGIGSIETTCR